jgi:hypothetical protein
VTNSSRSIPSGIVLPLSPDMPDPPQRGSRAALVPRWRRPKDAVGRISFLSAP